MSFSDDQEPFCINMKEEPLDEDMFDSLIPNYSEESLEMLDDVEYFRPDKTQLVYNGYVYNFVKKNKNDTLRWRCASCSQCGIVTKDDKIIRHPDKETRHKQFKCYVMLELQKECLKKYEILKHDARKPEFKFKQEYKKATDYLKYTYPIDVVDFYWPNERKARSTINSIRQKYVKNSKTKKLNTN